MQVAPPDDQFLSDPGIPGVQSMGPQNTIERLECSKAISGWDGLDWVGLEISEGTDSKSTALRC